MRETRKTTTPRSVPDQSTVGLVNLRLATRVGAALVWLIALAACQGGASGSGSPSPDSEFGVSSPPDTSKNQWPVETGPPATIVSIGSHPGSAVALFPDGTAYYSPDGYNLAGGGNSRMAYAGPPSLAQIVPAGGGVLALFQNGQAYFSPDGMNLGGGGATTKASDPNQQVVSITALPYGVDAVVGTKNAVYYSTSGARLAEGAIVYPGGQGVVSIVPTRSGDAVVSLFADGSAYLSPNNQYLAGGGSTANAVGAGQGQVVRILPAGGGGVFSEVLPPAQPSLPVENQVYLSADGSNLTGGGATVRVNDWVMLGRGPFGVRDSAHGAVFNGKLYLSGGFRGYLGSNSCFYTCSYFDLWASSDLTGNSWASTPAFATATAPDPRDAQSEVNNGVMDEAVPTDFYDSYSPIVNWQGRLVAIGSTIWTSSDGSSWQRQNNPDGTAVPGPELRRAGENSRAVVFGSYLYYFQEETGDLQRTNSPTASQWTDLGPIPNFGTRCGAMVFVAAGRIWIEGGGPCDYSATYNDIWYSADGLTWTHSARKAAWSPRLWSCVAVDSSGVAWMAGGYSPTDWNNVAGVITIRYAVDFADAWYSKNGVDWRQYKQDLGSGLPDDGVMWAVHAPTCFIGNDGNGNERLIVAAGKSSRVSNDYWADVQNLIVTLQLPAASALP